jgi:hypothetical protein
MQTQTQTMQVSHIATTRSNWSLFPLNANISITITVNGQESEMQSSLLQELRAQGGLIVVAGTEGQFVMEAPVEHTDAVAITTNDNVPEEEDPQAPYPSSWSYSDQYTTDAPQAMQTLTAPLPCSSPPMLIANDDQTPSSTDYHHAMQQD